MELAGLEPATSWVRSRRSGDAEVADLQDFSDGADAVLLPRIGEDIRRFLSFQALLAMSA
jgi:hypothetical protein